MASKKPVAPPPDTRPTCLSFFLDTLAGDPSPTPEVVEQGAKAASQAAAAKALNVQMERFLVVPLRSSTVRFFVNLSEALADAAEIVPLVLLIPDVVRANIATAKANYNRTCKPAFP